MKPLDYGIFVLAGVLGAFYDSKLAWIILAVWAFLKFLGIV